MISKKARQGRILDLVGKRVIASQEELAAFLRREGVEVTQSTLSRDIRALGLIKIRGRYHVSREGNGSPPVEYVQRAFQQFLVRIGLSGNILMLKTSPGNAHSLGVVVDAAEWPEVLGTVAGDDTVFVLLKNRRLGAKVLRRIKDFCS